MTIKSYRYFFAALVLVVIGVGTGIFLSSPRPLSTQEAKEFLAGAQGAVAALRDAGVNGELASFLKTHAEPVALKGFDSAVAKLPPSFDKESTLSLYFAGTITAINYFNKDEIIVCYLHPWSDTSLLVCMKKSKGWKVHGLQFIANGRLAGGKSVDPTPRWTQQTGNPAYDVAAVSMKSVSQFLDLFRSIKNPDAIQGWNSFLTPDLSEMERDVFVRIADSARDSVAYYYGGEWLPVRTRCNEAWRLLSESRFSDLEKSGVQFSPLSADAILRIKPILPGLQVVATAWNERNRWVFFAHPDHPNFYLSLTFSGNTKHPVLQQVQVVSYQAVVPPVRGDLSQSRSSQP